MSQLSIKLQEVERREGILMSHLKEIYENLSKLETNFSQQERKLEEEIISLKIQLEESRRTKEVRKNRVWKKEEFVIPSSRRFSCVETSEAPCIEGTSSKPPRSKIEENSIIIL